MQTWQPQAAGWYPDPLRRYEFRYFNGERWTGDVSVYGQRYLDPLPTSTGPLPGAPTTVLRGPAPAPGWTSTPAPVRGPAPLPPAPPDKPGRGFAIASMVVAITGVVIGWVPFVYIAGAAAAIAAFVFGIIGLRHARRHEGYGKRFAVAGLVIAPVALGMAVLGLFFTRFVTERFVRAGDYTLVANLPCRVTSGTSPATVVFDGTITNNNDYARDYVLTLEYRVGALLLDSTRLTVDGVGSGETQAWRDQSIVLSGDTTRLTCSVSHVGGPLSFG